MTTYEEHTERIEVARREDAKFDPRPRKRYRATGEEWAEIRAHFEGGPCFACLRPHWSELHHLLPRSHGGDDVTVNLMPLCANCHRRIEARDPEVRANLRASLMEENLGYLRYRLGETWQGWLDRNYAEIA